MKRGWSWLERQRGAWAGTAIDLLFPPRCVLCHREEDGTPPAEAGPDVLPGNECPVPLCRGCVGELTAGGPRCLRCGQSGGAEPCRACRGQCRDWDGIVVLGGYGGLLRQAVLRAKHPRGEDVSAALASLLLLRHAEIIASWSPDVIVPVPMYWWRRVVRGTNAAEVIAGQLGRLAGLPVRRLLRRTRPTVMQNRLPFGERRANVRDVFGSRQRGVAGMRVLLVDDVVTTGGTLSGCRRALSTAGAAAVHVAVLARADHGGDDGEERADAPE